MLLTTLRESLEWCARFEVQSVGAWSYEIRQETDRRGSVTLTQISLVGSKKVKTDLHALRGY